ncbi:hypothetical protein BDF14DRAFT_1746176 [Spinellus fusiger]|nr:hypothetical protein BDF14DRAFT_1746176 [Spinellus fusiger]
MSQKVEYYSLEYKCHLCQYGRFVDARCLHDHYITVEGICYPNTKPKTYNTKYKKFISASEARKRKNIVFVFGCISCSNHFEKLDDLTNHLKEKHEPKVHLEVDNGFKKLLEMVKLA